jgi:hypothetical protein
MVDALNRIWIGTYLYNTPTQGIRIELYRVYSESKEKAKKELEEAFPVQNCYRYAGKRQTEKYE